MAIGFYPFVKRFIMTGWSLGDFLDWLPRHPLVFFPNVPTVAEYWKRYVFSGLFKPGIAAVDPSLTIPHLFHTPPLYPGRMADYTYTVGFEAWSEAEGMYVEDFVTTISDTVKTPEEIMEWAKGVTEEKGPSPKESPRDFFIESAEWKERQL